MINRIGLALSDAVTAGYFILVWFRPFLFGEATVRHAMLMMIVEFILIHATAFLSSFAGSRRIVMFSFFVLIYMVFIGSFSYSFKAWWPMLAFVWLLTGKLRALFKQQVESMSAPTPPSGDWALSVLVYLVGVFITTLLPMPQFGITSTIVPALGIEGSGLWVSQPHRVIAFGAMYFGMLSWCKVAGWKLPETRGHRSKYNNPPVC